GADSGNGRSAGDATDLQPTGLGRRRDGWRDFPGGVAPEPGRAQRGEYVPRAATDPRDALAARHLMEFTMLERTLSTQFIPGTNLRGEVAGANWSYLLPSLELEHIVCLGAPTSASLAALARLGRVSIVADASALADLLPLDRWGSVTHIESRASDAL